MKCYDKNSQDNEKECDTCKHANRWYRNPSAIILKMLHKYQVKCLTCNKSFTLKDLPQHEIICKQTVCSNELCGMSLVDDAPLQLDNQSIDDMIEQNSKVQKIKFKIMDEEFVSCSKKCKKVTKFAYMLRQNNEQQILRAFESMLRKKARKP